MCSASCKIANKWQLELLILSLELREHILFIRQNSLSEKIRAITSQFPLTVRRFGRSCLQGTPRAQPDKQQPLPSLPCGPSPHSAGEPLSRLPVLGHLSRVSLCASSLRQQEEYLA